MNIYVISFGCDHELTGSYECHILDNLPPTFSLRESKSNIQKYENQTMIKNEYIPKYDNVPKLVWKKTRWVKNTFQSQSYDGDTIYFITRLKINAPTIVLRGDDDSVYVKTPSCNYEIFGNGDIESDCIT